MICSTKLFVMIVLLAVTTMASGSGPRCGQTCEKAGGPKFKCVPVFCPPRTICIVEATCTLSPHRFFLKNIPDAKCCSTKAACIKFTFSPVKGTALAGDGALGVGSAGDGALGAGLAADGALGVGLASDTIDGNALGSAVAEGGDDDDNTVYV
eukprot:TRINITY_DN1075_c0_g1_i1.p2 TRINITY_DN1075_c0_g1~~TRINITY_DN1075_c0_g1_i1.p2  ORF type:complete len:153 (+),score=23.90 TRINITY_DN1075_c0_g1_i1:412-870(+)